MSSDPEPCVESKPELPPFWRQSREGRDTFAEVAAQYIARSTVSKRGRQAIKSSRPPTARLCRPETPLTVRRRVSDLRSGARSRARTCLTVPWSAEHGRGRHSCDSYSRAIRFWPESGHDIASTSD